jgi:hypothetical protein
MRRFVVAVAVTLAITTLLAGQIALGGNSDAAHACQQGGYLTLQGADGTLFKNAGECTAFAAHGGAIIGITATCSFVSGQSGCITLNGVAIREFDISSFTYLSTAAYTLTGSMTFSPICVTCGTPTASGGGTYTFAGASTFSGSWEVTSVYSPTGINFLDASNNNTTCALATARQVILNVSLKDATNTTIGGGWIETRLVTGGGTPTTNFVLAYLSVPTIGGNFYTPDTSGVTMAC